MARYTIWNVDIANLVGAYRTEDEAFVDVRDPVERFGPADAASWGLGWNRPDGSPEAIADAEDLIDRALGRAAATTE